MTITNTLWELVTFAAIATLAQAPLSLLLGWRLAAERSKTRAIIQASVLLALVMPPLATSTIILKQFSRQAVIGQMPALVALQGVFTQNPLVTMGLIGLPVLIRIADREFQKVRSYKEIAETLGACPTRVFFTIGLPLAGRTILIGALLATTRATTEYGAIVTTVVTPDAAAKLFMVSVILGFIAIRLS